MRLTGKPKKTSDIFKGSQLIPPKKDGVFMTELKHQDYMMSRGVSMKRWGVSMKGVNEGGCQ